ncbi:MAG: hypothetical protein KF680_11620 [Cryobacterium sp.]|nr:hypothetical protein [Cryobacterium sp.]
MSSETPSDELVIGTGTTTVLTADLERFAQVLDAVNGELFECSQRLARADRLVTGGELTRIDAPYSAILAEEAIDNAQLAAANAIVSSELLATGLRTVVEHYESNEEQLAHAQQALAAQLGYGLAFFLPGLALLLAPALATGLAGMGIGVLLLPEELRRRFVQNLLAIAHAKAGILSDPVTVELVRRTVTSSDDFLAGLLRIPAGAAQALGDEGMGVTGLGTTTAVIGGAAASVGMLRETRVTVRQTSVEGETAPATGVKDRVDRIPSSHDQIRIERYHAPGKPDRVEVFIGGTSALGAVTGGEAWDMTSNIQAMAEGSAGSARAVLEAMRLAGVTADTPIVFTGYSQGGLLAAQLAASGDWNTAGLVTVGAPAGQIAVPSDVAYLAIEHTDDLVPALGGRFVHSEPLVIRRRFFEGPIDVSERLLPAHELTNYVRTAQLVDKEPDARIRSIVEGLAAEGYTVTSTMYRADRVG